MALTTPQSIMSLPVKSRSGRRNPKGPLYIREPAMSKTPRRKATLADAMLFIAGTGLAFCAWRGMMSMPIWNGMPDSLQRYYFQALGAVAFLTPLSLTLLAIALRQPRPRLRRVVSEPAVVVGLSVLFVLAINTALLWAIMGMVGFSMATFTGGKVFYYCRLLAEQSGMAVGATWFIQIISGRFRKPRGWMDLLGSVLGVCWILLAVSSVVFTLL
jgi:hypothetical protein